MYEKSPQATLGFSMWKGVELRTFGSVSSLSESSFLNNLDTLSEKSRMRFSNHPLALLRLMIKVYVRLCTLE